MQSVWRSDISFISTLPAITGELPAAAFTKSASDKKIAGVCGGLAEYLGCDPTLIRIAWAVLAFGFGIGVLLYMICAFILPEE